MPTCICNRVLYGNRTPYRKFGEPYPPDADYLLRTMFDYGEYDREAPYAGSGRGT